MHNGSESPVTLLGWYGEIRLEADMIQTAQ